jgi:hypothetical protein
MGLGLFSCSFCAQGPFDTAIDLQLHQKEFHSADKSVAALTLGNSGAITGNPQAAQQAVVEGAESEPSPSTLRGKLADDFPGKAKLEAGELTTYAQIRKAIKKDPEAWYKEIEGVGEATALKVAEAVGASQEGDEEE